MASEQDADSDTPSEIVPTQFYNMETASEYRMKELVLFPDSFDVETVPDKEKIFTVKPKVISFLGEKTMFDVNGNKLFEMTGNPTSVLQFMYLIDYRSNSEYTVRKKGLLPGRGRGTLYVWEGKGDTGEPFIELKSNTSRSEVKIAEISSGKQLAHIERSTFGIRHVATGASSYKVNVSAGVELAFIMMLVVCSDEHHIDLAGPFY